MNRAALTVAFVAALAGDAAAQEQDELPEERAVREALGQAQGKYEEALGLIEAYGRGRALSAERARHAALDRLAAPVGPARTRRRSRVHADAAYDELAAFRDAIRRRLRALAPERHAAPAPPEEPEDEPEQSVLLRVLDVQDLVVAPEDHVAPNTGLGAGLDRSGAYDFTDGVRTATAGLAPETLIELVDDAVQDDGGSVELSSGRLVTRLTPAALARVERLLAALRAERGGLVDLEVRVYRLHASLFARLRDEASALTDAAEAALARGDGATLLASHHVLAHDGQRVHVWRGRSRSYVADIDVNQTGVLPVQEPRVAVINEGLVVEARPIVDRARGRVLLDVALSRTRLEPTIDVQKVEDLELETPLLHIARTTGTASVPLGRGALLGGALETGAGGADDQTCVVYVRPRLTGRRR